MAKCKLGGNVPTGGLPCLLCDNMSKQGLGNSSCPYLESSETKNCSGEESPLTTFEKGKWYLCTKTHTLFQYGVAYKSYEDGTISDGCRTCLHSDTYRIEYFQPAPPVIIKAGNFYYCHKSNLYDGIKEGERYYSPKDGYLNTDTNVILYGEKDCIDFLFPDLKKNIEQKDNEDLMKDSCQSNDTHHSGTREKRLYKSLHILLGILLFLTSLIALYFGDYFISFILVAAASYNLLVCPPPSQIQKTTFQRVVRVFDDDSLNRKRAGFTMWDSEYTKDPVIIHKIHEHLRTARTIRLYITDRYISYTAETLRRGQVSGSCQRSPYDFFEFGLRRTGHRYDIRPNKNDPSTRQFFQWWENLVKPYEEEYDKDYNL